MNDIERKSRDALIDEITELRNRIAELEVSHAAADSARGEVDHARLLDAVGQAVMATDLNGRIVYLNRAAVELYGWSAEDVLGKNIIDVMPATGRGRIAEEIFSRLLDGESWSGVFTVKRRNGRFFPVMVTDTPIFDSSGRVSGLVEISQDISEKLRADFEIREAKELLEEAQQLAHVGIWDWNPRTDKLIWSEELFRIHGMSARKRAWTLKSYFRMVHPDDRGKLKNDIDDSLKDGNFVTEYRIIRRDDASERVLHSVGEARFDDRGRPIRHLGVVMDITERKKGELEIAESEERFREVFSNMSNPVMICGLEPQVDRVALVDMNPAALSTFNLERKKVIGTELYDTLPGMREVNVAETFRHVSETGASVNIPTVHYRDGRIEKWIDIYVCRISSGAIVAVMTDQTERVLAEAERARLFTAIEQSPITIVIVDSDGVIRYANPIFDQLNGYAKGHAINENFWNIKGIRENSEIFGRLSSGEVWIGQLSGERADGRQYMEHTTISPVRNNDDDQIISYVVLARDVTRELALEKRLRERQRLESLGTLAGGIAHDFNNILQMIMGNAELCLNRTNVDDPLRDRYRKIIAAVSRASDLISQILTFTRQVEKERQPILLRDVADEVLDLLGCTLPADIEIQRDYDPISRSILGDPAQLNQAIVNLCLNATSAMEQTGGMLIVRIRPIEVDFRIAETLQGALAGPAIELTVADTGRGMDEATMSRIFEPYFTTSEKSRGAGLGLAVVDGIVKSHNGAIYVESKVGVGSTFKLYFPVFEDSGEKLNIDEEDYAGVTGSGAVMFVDDEPIVQEVGKLLLANAGFDVVVESDGEGAFKHFRANPERYDIIVTDMNMPRMLGTQLAEKVKKIRPDIPVILCTGYGDLIDPEVIAASGIRLVVKKPVNYATLTKTIVDILAG